MCCLFCDHLTSKGTNTCAKKKIKAGHAKTTKVPFVHGDNKCNKVAVKTKESTKPGMNYKLSVHKYSPQLFFHILALF